MWAHTYVYIIIYMSPTRGSYFFLEKVTALGVLCCFALFVCLTLLASFFLPSHLSLKHVLTLYIGDVHVALLRRCFFIATCTMCVQVYCTCTNRCI